MEVKITFDTEKESVEDLNRLIAALQDLVQKKERAVTLGNPLTASSITKPAQVHVQRPQQSQQQNVLASGQTAGGGRVIPYQDISGLMEKVLSGRK